MSATMQNVVYSPRPLAMSNFVEIKKGRKKDELRITSIDLANPVVL